MIEPPTWDIPDFLAEFIIDDPVAGKDLVATFIEDTGRQMTALQQALAAPDVSLAGKLLHSLKGSSSQMGAMDLSRACEDAEQQLARGDASAVVSGLKHLNVLRETVVDLMARHLAESGAPE